MYINAIVVVIMSEAKHGKRCVTVNHSLMYYELLVDSCKPCANEKRTNRDFFTAIQSVCQVHNQSNE